MDPQLVTAIVAGVAVIVSGILGRPRALPDPVVAITKMVDVWERLPNGKTKEKLLSLISKQVDGLEAKSVAEQVGRRNWYGVFWAVVFTAAGAVLGWVILSAGGWWLIGLVLPSALVLSGIIVFGQNVTKIPRAANGQSLEYQRKKATPKI